MHKKIITDWTWINDYDLNSRRCMMKIISIVETPVYIHSMCRVFFSLPILGKYLQGFPFQKTKSGLKNIYFYFLFRKSVYNNFDMGEIVM